MSQSSQRGQLNVDELDLDPGLIGTQKKLFAEASVKNVEAINKHSYINKWLQSNSGSESSSNVSNHTASDKLHVAKPSSDAPSIASTQSSSRNSSTRRRMTPSVQTSVKIYPAGYNPNSFDCNKKQANSISSNNSTQNKPPKPLNPNSEQIKLNASKDLPILPTEQQQASHAIIQAFKAIPSQPLDPEWEAIFKKQEELEKQCVRSDSSSNNQKMKRHIKRSLGLCECNDCERDIPLELVYPEEEKFETHIVSTRKKPSPLLKSTDDLIRNIMLAPVSKTKTWDNEMTILTHGSNVPQPQMAINQTNLLPDVIQKLHLFKYDKCKPVQSFGFPAIRRGQNVVLVSTKHTGKTLTYVPAMASFVMDQEDLKDFISDCSNSPILIILGNNASVAEDVHAKMCEMLRGHPVLNNVWFPLLPITKKDVSHFFARKNSKAGKMKKEQKLDVLITTVDTLIALLNEKIINLKRLRHFVVENLNIVLDKLENRLNLVLNAIESMLRNRNSYDGVQFISTGEKWTKKVETFVSKLQSFPIIIIANPMQAALYGRAQFQLQYVPKKLKAEKLSEMFKAMNYFVYKCIVVCILDEIATLESQFAIDGIQYTTITDEMTGAEVVDLIMIWKTNPGGKNIVLLCTDAALRMYVNVSIATFLVNYSLPSTWTRFSQRFSTLISSYQCPLAANFCKTKFNCHIVTYVDEKNLNRFPRLSNFFTSNNMKVPEELLNFCKEEKYKAEQEKVSLNKKLCKLLLNFGTCNDSTCNDRHIFSPLLEKALITPCNGKIKCKFIKMYAINHYCLQIIEFRDLNGETRKMVDYATKVKEILNESAIYENSPDAITGQMYLYETEKTFFRCVIKRIVKYESVGDTMTSQPLVVEIFGLENGVKSEINVNKLFKLPARLENIPPSVVEVYVAHLIPPFKESRWTKPALQMLFDELKKFDNSTVCHGHILLRLNDTIWVNDLHFREMHSPIGNKLIISEFLKSKNIYDNSSESLENFYRLCQEADIKLPEYKIIEEVIVRPKLIQAKANWAHIRPDELNPVYFSAATNAENIYLRHTKYDSLLKNLEEDIASSKHLLRRKLSRDEIIEGCYYCATDATSGSWCRILLHKVENDIAKCFYVDYGDFATLPIGDLRFLSDELITRLPFQAIECCLYGVKPPPGEKLVDVLYEQCYEPNTDFFKTFYAKLISADKSDTFSVPERKKYKIMLLDYYTGKGYSLNAALVDAKIAKELPGEDIEQIELPSPADLPNVSNLGTDDNVSEYSMENELNEDDFDFIVPGFNPYEDEELPKIGAQRKFDHRINETVDTKSTTQNDRFIPMTAAKKTDDKFLPNIRWYQDDANVYLEFIFIENYDYKFAIMRSRFLSFHSVYKGNTYESTMNLYANVSRQFVHESKTHFIRIVLTKSQPDNWPRLLKSTDKMANIKYKMDKVTIDASESDDEDTNLLQSKDIDNTFFNDVVVTEEGEVEENLTDLDSGSDYGGLDED